MSVIPLSIHLIYYTNMALPHIIRQFHSCTCFRLLVSGIIEPLSDIIPVCYIPDSGNVIGSHILVLEIVGVLPNIYAKQGYQSCKGWLGINHWRNWERRFFNFVDIVSKCFMDNRFCVPKYKTLIGWWIEHILLLTQFIQVHY